MQQGVGCTETQFMRIMLISSDQFSQSPHEMCFAQRPFAGPVRGEIVTLWCSQHALPVMFVRKAIELGRRWLAIRCRRNLREVCEATDGTKIKKCQVMPNCFRDGIRRGDTAASAESVVQWV